MGDRIDTLVRAAGMADEMLGRLRMLVECESPSNSPRGLEACAQLITHWLEAALRRPVRVVREGDNPHLLAAASEPQVLLLGHFDTVWPTGTIADWPFSITDGIASGPGVFDMKAGIVQMIAAINLLPDPSTVSVLLTSDEEVGSRSSRALIEQQARAAGAVLVCEPSADGGAVKIGRKGIANYRVNIRGRAAHSGLEPALGINASVELAHQILAITAIGDGETTVTPTVLTAGTTVNTVPEHASCAVDVRAWTHAELTRADTAMSRLSPQLDGARIEVTGGIERSPFEPAAAAALNAMTEAAAADLGLPLPEATRSAGGSDGNLTAALGIPTLDGLGAVGAHPHGRGERVEVASMGPRAALLAGLVRRVIDSSPSSRSSATMA
ncbi:M20 family metallopeptidase [Nocardia nova]|uniref:M20 family metallopeptidase n=1 Tax=Nocardia nova TaxID=37330 RepID=UPI0025B0A58F|nr:M20 family metallopeptidase [Nocardia nova]MDN2495974.1 M20 family metallopeptidase [Nocardia nova]